MLPALLAGEETECTLKENEARVNHKFGFLSTQGKIIFCVKWHCWIGNMTSFTQDPRVSLRPPNGLDHGEATSSGILFYFVYKCHEFEKLQNIVSVTHMRAIRCGRATPDLQVLRIATQGRCVGRGPFQRRQELGAAIGL